MKSSDSMEIDPIVDTKSCFCFNVLSTSTKIDNQCVSSLECKI